MMLDVDRLMAFMCTFDNVENEFWFLVEVREAVTRANTPCTRQGSLTTLSIARETWKYICTALIEKHIDLGEAPASDGESSPGVL
jgi:hypothetical protein